MKIVCLNNRDRKSGRFTFEMKLNLWLENIVDVTRMNNLYIKNVKEAVALIMVWREVVVSSN